ncbi:MAG: HypC/HybG/HupF family hydrogenase formation chaperone [Parcubacteria group bacterium]|nr:HypC/HybG/HupF family hydrogenase formation chaperone [Parcubacteria group bacterium]
MCLSFPIKIEKIENGSVVIKNDHGNLKINISLIKNPKVGDWLLVHANLAIKKISKKEAYEIQGYLSGARNSAN